MTSRFEFTDALALLRRWQVERSEPAFRSFERGFLNPAVSSRLRRLHPATVRAIGEADLRQAAALKFIRPKTLAAMCEARSVGLWLTTIDNALRDELRAHRRREREVLGREDDATTEQEGVEATSGEGALRALISRADAARAAEAVGSLTNGGRRAIAAFTWDTFEAQLSASDREAMAVGARRSVAQIVEILQASTPYDAPTSVAAFSSDDDLRLEWERCLDTYRRARSRAFESLGAKLGVAAGGGRP